MEKGKTEKQYFRYYRDPSWLEVLWKKLVKVTYIFAWLWESFLSRQADTLLHQAVFFLVFIWHCSHWNWTVKCCLFSLKLPCTWAFHAAYRDCSSWWEYLSAREGSSFLVRLLTEGIDFIIRAKWHLPGNRHVESHLLCMYLSAVLLETVLYGICLPFKTRNKNGLFEQLISARFSSYWMFTAPIAPLTFHGFQISCLKVSVFTISPGLNGMS